MMKETLMKFNKDKLVSALKTLAFQGYSKMKKEELADTLAQLLENDENYEKVYQSLELPARNSDAGTGAQNQIKIPQSETEDCLESYLKAFINLYGAITPEKAMELYNLYHKENSMAHQEFYTRVTEMEKKNSGIHLSEGYLCHESYLQNGALLAELIKTQGDKPYYMPAKEKVLDYADESYFEKKGAYVFLEHFISKLDNVDTAKICAAVQLRNLQGKSPAEIFKVFEENHVVFHSEQQARKAMQLIVDLIHDTRVHENRGYTQNEITKVYHPQSYALEETAAKKQPVRVHKVGRNDPCPCGSGKKYKKCCGR